MKKVLMLLLIAVLGGQMAAVAQGAEMLDAVARLDGTKTAADYEALEKTFLHIAATPKAGWLPYYYAALCNAQIGFLYQDDGEKIEPYSLRGEEQAKKAISLLDTATHKKELAEIYTVLSMVYRTRVFINPMTYGRKFGTLSQQVMQQAKQLDAANPRTLYLEAWVKCNTPRLWGGDKQLGRQLATQSLQLLEKVPATGITPHWGKAEDLRLLEKYK
ncbi:hypothetical protein [Chitinophaga nivalis]|uniref:Uncharacterized protein n=1 Tax=Chitinophaga nivalis TaxID=2991709 RepID=A0ABT3IP58_9BACT|nr:hypothetical protein [Chitinophaga nivalis]MCW3464552.1 hypothetical protein [Chitinophaga nivalis]MCW3485757.1 hypothetical protein [Chitinophaga nivalis]